MVAGFEIPTSGQILLNGQDITKLPPHKRPINTVFQRYALFPHLDVYDNVAFGLKLKKVADEKRPGKLRKLTPEEIDVKVINALKALDLEDFENRDISTLSGGQQQRVAIARALMSDPKVLLCDEATSALDPETTHSILELLKSLNKELGLTIVIISHQMSVIEAICNKVAIIDKSEIVSNGYLQDVFLSPTNEVAKKLIYSGHVNTGIKGEKFVKLMFTGEVDKPIITDIIQKCNILVSIMYAESKMLNDKLYGQIIFRLPYYDEDIENLKAFLTKEGVPFEEVDSDALY